MSSILPKERLKATRTNPKIAIFYGPPKIGKTTKVAELENCLVLDMERGAEALEVMRLPVTSIQGGVMHDDKGNLVSIGLDTVIAEIEAIGIAEFQKTGKKPKPPYKYLVVDTVDKLEDYCEISATKKYKESTIGKNFEGDSVLELPKGLGYYYLRKEVLYYIDRLALMCEHLILNSHIREKEQDKGGVAVTVTDLPLAGKLSGMVCAKADIIGYVYRENAKNPQLMVSFETFDSGTTMGGRFPRLAGKRIPFDWSQIYLPEETPAAEAPKA